MILGLLLSFIFINGFIGFTSFFIWHPLIFGIFERGCLIRTLFGHVHYFPFEKIIEFTSFSSTNKMDNMIAFRYLDDQGEKQILTCAISKYATIKQILSNMEKLYPLKDPSPEFIQEISNILNWGYSAIAEFNRQAALKANRLRIVEPHSIANRDDSSK